MDKNKQSLEDILKERLNGGLSAEDIKAIIARMAQMVMGFKDSMSLEMGRHKQEMSGQANTIREQIGQINAGLQNLAGVIDGNKSEMMMSHNKGMKEIEGKIPQMPDLAPMEKKMSSMSDMCDRRDNPEHIVEQVNVAETQIKRDRVEGLDGELKRIESKASAGMASRRVYQPYQDDFSSQTDGTTKTFYLSRAPLTEVVFVFGTDFPTILRPTIDFTVSNKTLTLTDAVPAPNTGATLLVQYFA